MSTTDEIKARIDIIDLISESVQLKRSGKNYVGFCPFHPNTRTPAFVVFPETGTWHCFGQCNEGGDLFKFVMKKEAWDFTEALRALAERAGVPLKPKSPVEEAQKEAHEHLRALLEDAVTFFRHQLLNTTAGRSALDYLHGRGLSDETIEVFGLGYAPKAWDALVSHFTAKGLQEDELLAAGLVSPRDSGGVYDRFRHRVVFPIRDARGRMTGFGARSLAPDDQPKYLNSPQTALFDKGRLLYGLDRASKEIRAQNQVVIVEGYLDVIALHQRGFSNVISPMGTALTEHQLGLLKRFTRRIVLALDADAAGQNATLKGLQVARRTLDREPDPVFDARGLLTHEARLRADIRVTTLPAGMDPDDIMRSEPERWPEILESARPIVVHVMETLAADRDLDDPKVKAEIAHQVQPLIKDLPDPIERDTYRQRLARLLQVDERTLLQQSQASSRRRRRSRRTARSGSVASGFVHPSSEQRDRRSQPKAGSSIATGNRHEAYCLGVLLRRPDLIYRVDRALQEAGLGRFSVQDFQNSDHQYVLRLIQESLEQEQAEPVHHALANLPLSLMDLADELLAMTENIDPGDPRVLRDLLRTILDLRRRNVSQNIAQLRFLMEADHQEGNKKQKQYQTMISQHIHARARLDRAIEKHVSRMLTSEGARPG